MKELSIEEKAKAYDEAIERAKNHRDRDGLTLKQYETIDIIFPELNESEDERIRKAIIEHFEWSTKRILNEFSNKKVIAWLEKQGEHKPAWSEEDMKMIRTLVAIFEVNYPNGFYKVNPIGTTDMQGIHSSEIIKWLKSIKDRVQPKQE